MLVASEVSRHPEVKKLFFGAARSSSVTIQNTQTQRIVVNNSCCPYHRDSTTSLVTLLLSCTAIYTLPRPSGHVVLYFFSCSKEQRGAYDSELPPPPSLPQNLFCFAERHVVPYGVDLDIFLAKRLSASWGDRRNGSFRLFKKLKGPHSCIWPGVNTKTPDLLQHLLSLI